MATQIKQTAQDIAAKWGSRLKGAVPEIQKGVSLVTESPMEKAAAKSDKWVQNTTSAKSRFESGLRATPIEVWKKNTSDKVAARLSGGVDAAMSKRVEFETHNINTINAILPTIDKMPDNTMEDSLARVRTFMEHMSKNKFRK